MKIFQKINRALGLTPNESRVVYFLVVSFLAGLCIKVFWADRRLPPPFDYSRSDSMFAARSAMIPLLDSIDAQTGDSLKHGAYPISKKYLLASLTPGCVHLNDATKEQLMRLPGIGDSTADAILDYREENGPFASIEDLKNIKGIGPRKFEKMKIYLAL